MILKGNQRKGGADLATHLLNAYDNEEIELAEVRGTVAEDLHGAFAEYEAIASGTRCKEPLYSLSINPSAPITRDQYALAIELAEHHLGLSGLPRAVVFHVKHGREHCHVVWCRVDCRTMKAVHMSHDRLKLQDLCRELALEFGIDLPAGFNKKKAEDITYGEKAQAEATGITPQQRRDEITAAWRAADSGAAFRAALEAKDYILARGDRRGFVVVDRYGHVHSLARQIEGVRTAALKAKLAPLTPDQLPSVEEARALVRQRQQAAEDRQRQALEGRRTAERSALKAKQDKRHRKLDELQQQMKIRHMADRLKLHAAQKARADAQTEQRRQSDAGRLARIMALVPGYRAVVRYIRRRQDKHFAYQQDAEGKALAQQHETEAFILQRKYTALAKIEAREQRSLETRLLRIGRIQERGRQERTRQRAQDIRQNADDITTRTERSGDDDNALAPRSWADRAVRLGKAHRPGKGLGHGQRR